MISIIVPIYRVEQYLEQCIESILAQTCEDIEIILVDDGSPDRCGAICDVRAAEDGRIRVIHRENAGVSAARNAGLDIARGEYIGFVDPDDWIAPQMYKRMLDSMKVSGADLAVCGYAYCGEDGKTDEKCLYQVRPEEQLDQREVMHRMGDIPPTIRHVVWNKLFRRKLLRDIRFPEAYSASEDVWFLTDYLMKTNRAVCVHEPLYFNRVREGSATHGGLEIHQLAQSFRANEYMYDRITEAYPELKPASQAFCLDVMTLKYNEARRQFRSGKTNSAEDADDLRRMRQTIHTEAFRALRNEKIYWKTRIAYLAI